MTPSATDLPRLVRDAGQHLASGQFAEAERLARRILDIHPDHPLALHLLAQALASTGRREEARSCFERAAALAPANPVIRENLGHLLRGDGKPREAIAWYQQALALQPQRPGAAVGLGAAFEAARNLAEAEASYRNALRPPAPHRGAYFPLANLLARRQETDEAIALVEEGLRNFPSAIEGLYLAGNLYFRAGRLNEAANAYSKALAIQPDYALALESLGSTLKQLHRPDEAAQAFRRALSFRPNRAQTLSNLAGVMKDQGRIDLALATYRQALALDPNLAPTHSALLYTLHYHPDDNPASLLAEHRRFDEQHARPLARQRRAWSNDRTPNRRLRIGYVSPDFRDHAAGWGISALFRAHDREGFEIYCYSDVAREDSFTRGLQVHVAVWRPTLWMSDAQLAARIEFDAVDILVDLSMHSAGGRPLLFARGPAPVQVTWNYPSTTGLSAMDYRFTDPYLDPPGDRDGLYSEQSIRLPRAYWCYEPMSPAAPVAPPPAQRNGFITFGCLNNFCKVNAPTLAMWAGALRRVENARLMILAPVGEHRRQTGGELADLGIDPARVRFCDPRPRGDYLQLYHNIDICLDTFPYNGHTTSLDALWMGVPVVTRFGNTAVSRGGWSFLSNLDLTDLGANHEAGFVEAAAGLAADRARLFGLRQTLRERLRQSPLMDAAGFARAIEAAYREIWATWCNASPPGNKAG